jgi:hypothetical protein
MAESILAYHFTEDSPKYVPSGTFSAFLSEGDFRFAAQLRFWPRVSQGPPGGPVFGFLVADLNSDRPWITDRLENILQPPGT